MYRFKVLKIKLILLIKRIFVIMKNEKEIVGTLLGFDDCVSKIKI